MTDTTTENTDITTSEALIDGQPTVEEVVGHDEPEPDTFPRQYVEELRRENADARIKARRADDLAQRLHAALTAAAGRLADPSDLPFDEAHLDDPDALDEAITGLLARKPHLASRRPAGSVGQGVTGTEEAFSLGALLRSRA